MDVAGREPSSSPARAGRNVAAGARDVADVSDPNLVLVYTASSQGYLEPCGCAARGKEMGGIARRATFVDSLRAAGDPVVLVEAGDFVGGGGEAGFRIGQTALQAMRAMKYDFVALGEAELGLGERFLRDLVAHGPAVAHVNWSHPLVGEAQKDGLMLQRHGLKIGVIGLLDPEMMTRDLGLQGLVVDPPAPAAEAAARSLRAAGADIVVVLGHTDFRRSGRMAGDSADTDVWVVGHGGKELSHPATVGRTLLLGCGNGGKLVGAIQLKLEDGGPLEFKNVLYPLRLTVREDPTIAAIVKGASTVPHRSELPAESPAS